MAIKTTIWGPIYWKFIHYISVIYPREPNPWWKHLVSYILNNLAILLPCENCAKHYNAHLLKHPITNDILNSRYKLSIWGINMHNLVNKYLKKTIKNETSTYSFYKTATRNFVSVNSTLWGVLSYVAILYPNKPTQEHKNVVKYLVQMIQYFFKGIGKRNYRTALSNIKLTDNALSSYNNYIKWFISFYNKGTNSNINIKYLTLRYVTGAKCSSCGKI